MKTDGMKQVEVSEWRKGGLLWIDGSNDFDVCQSLELFLLDVTRILSICGIACCIMIAGEVGRPAGVNIDGSRGSAGHPRCKVL